VRKNFDSEVEVHELSERRSYKIERKIATILYPVSTATIHQIMYCTFVTTTTTNATDSNAAAVVTATPIPPAET
jgi:hypothetical protein